MKHLPISNRSIEYGVVALTPRCWCKNAFWEREREREERHPTVSLAKSQWLVLLGCGKPKTREKEILTHPRLSCLTKTQWLVLLGCTKPTQHLHLPELQDILIRETITARPSRILKNNDQGKQSKSSYERYHNWKKVWKTLTSVIVDLLSSFWMETIPISIRSSWI